MRCTDANLLVDGGGGVLLSNTFQNKKIVYLNLHQHVSSTTDEYIIEETIWYRCLSQSLFHFRNTNKDNVITYNALKDGNF